MHLTCTQSLLYGESIELIRECCSCERGYQISNQEPGRECVDRLPSIGTISKLALEANHLASIEVALAMKLANPQEAIGNCIHGHGTTKHHRKYQNFQVTLPDGTSRTIGMMEMAAGDTMR